MKKTFYSAIFMVLFTVALSINAFAMTDAERDLYNHQYYPQSVNNGGINQAPQSHLGTYIATWGRTFYGTVLNGNMRDNFNLMESCLILFDIAITRMYISRAR